MMNRVLGVAAAMLFLLGSGVASGQLRGIKADVTPLVEQVEVHSGTTVRVALRVRLPDGFHVQSDRPRDPSLIPTALAVEPPAGVSAVEIVYPASTDLQQIGSDQPLAVFEREFAIGVQLAVDRSVTPGELKVPARLRYQACNDTTCFAPVTTETMWTMRVVASDVAVSGRRDDVFGGIAFGRGHVPPATSVAVATPRAERALAGDGVGRLDDFTVLGSAGGYLNSADFLTFIRRAETGVKERGMFEGRGPLAILFIVFLGGLALNLTPCVLPMIPINLAIIGAGASAGSRGRGLMLGTAYGLAMALVYGVLGLVVILTAGTFGTINASPWFNLGIAALFVVLGLAMFDFVVIDFSRFSSGLRPGEASRGTVALAFGMGGVAALLAGACVAPVVIQVVLFSSNLYATGTASALALPFILGVGMAVPWPIAGAGLAALPRPGAWMVRVKQAFGVLILATAAYYGYLAYELFENRWVDPATVTSSVQEKLKAGWHSSLADGLATAARERKPVLVDLWATWCKNCLTMDKTTLADPAVTSALAGYVKIKFQAEQPDQPPAQAVMKRFDAVGLPTYVILRPK